MGMEILPVNNLNNTIERRRQDDRQHPQKRHQPRKRERIGSAGVYTPGGAVEQEEPVHKIDVLV